MVKRFSLCLAFSVTDERYRWHARVSLVCSAGSPAAILVVHLLVLAGISQIHMRQALQGSGNLSWEHGRLNNQLTQLLLATLHIFTCLN